ncbi:MAG TPA: hypothetical protein VHO04_09720 [Sphingopyxis sp.]|uniref:hypothetical protein n=1 Tax=Sphingopyxis sp. TaxID=1908224 RepID=UPI002E363C87|nr:hypothetical protein [Sphingopyxis sp.]HEX2812948.1 hypothetical protein [Sphingopyxis sp.]
MTISRVAFTCLAIILSIGTAHAQQQDWRTCAVEICSKGECDGPNSNLIVVAPADFADPGFGGEAVMMQQLSALSERLYPTAQGWSRNIKCDHRYSEKAALDLAKAHIQLAQAPPASREIKIANPFDVWAYTASPTASNNATSSSSPANTPKPATGTGAPTGSVAGEPMNFMMWVQLREPINGMNAACFHAIKRKPAPEGYRGSSPTLKNALPIIKSYFPLMLQQCRRYGTPVSENVEFATDDISPAAKRAQMQADVERWRKQGFPEVYISN